MVKPERHYLGAGALGLLCVGLFLPNTINGSVRPWQFLLLFALQGLLFLHVYRRDKAFEKAEETRKLAERGHSG